MNNGELRLVVFNWPLNISLLDTDECKYDLDNCHADATCTNINGSFNCTCLIGYAGDGVSCIGKSSI